MKIVFASDSYKGSLKSEDIIKLLEEVTAQIFPDAVTEGVLVADGGEGTMDAVVKELHGSYRTIEVQGPLFEKIQAAYGLLPGNRAIIEMAEASGLPLVPEEKRNPLKTTTYGTGMLIKDALDQGIRNIVIAIGGSATNDGGMGAMSALGVKFLDEKGNVLKGCGENLALVRKIDLGALHPSVSETVFTVMCDVKNPLLGAQGATYTFGMQKGADREKLNVLEKGMENYSRIVEAFFQCSASGKEGAGAAGGLGFALMTFLNAKLKSGIDTVLDLVGFDEKIKTADLVITGEGRMDWQSSYGKVPSGVGDRCKAAGVPAVAIVGGLLDGYQTIYEHGISSIATTVNGIMELENAMENSEKLYKDAAFRLLSALKCGMQINENYRRRNALGESPT